jgi:hypothetical protein
LAIDGNGDVGTDLGAQGAGGAATELFGGDDGRQKPLAVDFVAKMKELTRTGDGAERAPLAAGFVDNYLGHVLKSFPAAVGKPVIILAT